MMKSVLITSPLKFLRKTRIFRTTSSNREYERELESCLDHFVEQWNTPIKQGTIQLQDFEISRQIGKGNFGQVVLARFKGNGTEYALKVLPKGQIIEKRDLEYVRLERDIHRCISFKFIVSLVCHFINDTHVFLCLEFVPGGEFFTLMRTMQRLSEKDAKFYAAQILLALEYLYRVRVVYRDLKPENILVDSKGYLKLGDLGFARLLVSKAFTLCGTPEYFAPEILSRESCGISVDFWSFGMLIYELIFSETAFFSDIKVRMFQRILYMKLTFPSAVHCSCGGLHLLICLLKSPRKRLIDAKKIKKHPWFRSVDFNKIYRKEVSAPAIPNSASSCADTEFGNRIFFEEPSRLPHGAEFADF